MNRRLLAIYLNDHLAGSVAGRQLAARCLASNQGTALGDHLSRLLSEIDTDRHALEALMKQVGAAKDPVKQAGAWTVERLSRLKLNGRLFGYSDLSRLEELEALCTGIEAKGSMWRALAEVAPSDEERTEMARLENRARRQRRGLEPFRLDAARRAIGR